MATRYDRVVNSLPASGFVRPTNAPAPRPMASPGMGAGSPRTIASMDPRSLVPINRSQPVATDGGEARRLMENRSGMQPPSSFSGAGQAYTSGFAEPTMTTAVMPQTFTDPGPVADPDVMYMTGGPVATSAPAMGNGQFTTDRRGWRGGVGNYNFRRAEKVGPQGMSRRDAFDAIQRWKVANPGVPMSELPPELAALVPERMTWEGATTLPGLLGG